MNIFKAFSRNLLLVHRPKYYFSAVQASKRLTDEIVLTEDCLKKIEERQQNHDKKVLRIEIEGGVGCSGYKYNFRFDEKIDDEDFIYEKNDKPYVVVDELTLKMMKGSVVDYENVMIRSGFVVSVNPNADKSCSCKVSFSPKESVFS